MTKFIDDRPISKSTQWARDNKELVKQRNKARRHTIQGKLVSLLTQTRYRAKHVKKFENNLTLDFMKNLYEEQAGLCALSGIEMTVYGTKGSDDYWNSISIDRINSNGGYTMDNVQFVCTGINRMKQEMPNQMFIDFCKKVGQHHD